MARRRYPPSVICTRLAALSFGLAIFGCVVDWFKDGSVGIVSTIGFAVAGVVFTMAAHRFSKRNA